MRWRGPPRACMLSVSTKEAKLCCGHNLDASPQEQHGTPTALSWRVMCPPREELEPCGAMAFLRTLT